MRKIYTFIVAIIIIASGLIPQQLFAQSPEKMSYQAVIRSASQNLIANQAIGMQISVIQGSATGTIVFVETHSPTTNANGLISVEIGMGTIVSGSFSIINWSDGPYFIKTETDPAGGNAYSIVGTSQLLSVPYALFAKTADSVTAPETDPVYTASVAAAINANDTTYWNAKLDSFVETDPIYGASIAAGITGLDTTYWNAKLDSYVETDPIYGASIAAGITGLDTTYWNAKLDSYTETDPIFTNSLAAVISSLDTTHWGMVYGWGNHNTSGYFGDGGEAVGADRSLGNLDSNSLAFITDTMTRLMITADGKVGIGTATPTTDFEVDGNTKLNGTIDAEGSYNWGTFRLRETTLSHTAVHNSILQISNTSGISSSQANIKFDAGPGGHGRAIINSQYDSYGGYYGGLLNFKVRYGATSYHSALIIRGNGRVGIGNTNPQAPLHVNGRIYQSGTGLSTFIGEYAGANDNLTSNRNVFVGNRSGYANTNGFSNVFVGYYCGYSNTTGNSNTANGYYALRNNTTGYNNTANGYNAMLYNTTGHRNSANGSFALYRNSTGYNNTANGYYALYYNTTGYYNSANGAYSLRQNSSGDYNTANGYNSLYYTTTGNYNTGIGYYTRVTGTASNSTAIGNYAYMGTSNRIILGNSSISWIGGHSTWYNTSDARAKTNIKEDVAGLDFILNLRPVTYYFDKDKMDELTGNIDSSEYAEKYEINQIKQSGFLAQEVEAAADKVGYDFIGLSKPKDDVKNYSLSYAMFVVPLVKATQEQQKVIEQQQQTIDEMKKELAEIKAMLLEKK